MTFAQRFPGTPGFLNQNQNSTNMTSAQLDFRLSLFFQVIDLKYNIIRVRLPCLLFNIQPYSYLVCPVGSSFHGLPSVPLIFRWEGLRENPPESWAEAVWGWAASFIFLFTEYEGSCSVAVFQSRQDMMIIAQIKVYVFQPGTN